jgi:hypothetical protein
VPGLPIEFLSVGMGGGLTSQRRDWPVVKAQRGRGICSWNNCVAILVWNWHQNYTGLAGSHKSTDRFNTVPNCRVQLAKGGKAEKVRVLLRALKQGIVLKFMILPSMLLDVMAQLIQHHFGTSCCAI